MAVRYTHPERGPRFRTRRPRGSRPVGALTRRDMHAFDADALINAAVPDNQLGRGVRALRCTSRPPRPSVSERRLEP